MKQKAYLTPEHLVQKAPLLASYIEPANHVDIKVVEGEVSLPEFIAGMISYYPGWLKFLYGVRWFFVRLLGMTQAGVPQTMQITPEAVAMMPGEPVSFFTVTTAVPDQYWLAEASDKHLTAYLGIVVEPLARGNRFYVVTIVHYHHWSGPVYFTVIRPFHHLVVGRMAKAGVQGNAS
jgi:hypothetical protein